MFNKNLSFYVPIFICRSNEQSYKQNGTMWSLRNHQKWSIKGGQGRRNPRCVYMRAKGWPQKFAGPRQLGRLYMLHRREGGFIRKLVNHSNSPHRRREDWRCGREQTLCLLVRFTAALLSIVSLFTGLSMRLH